MDGVAAVRPVIKIKRPTVHERLLVFWGVQGLAAIGFKLQLSFTADVAKLLGDKAAKATYAAAKAGKNRK